MISLVNCEEEVRDAFSDARNQYILSVKENPSLFNIEHIPLQLDILPLWWSQNVMHAFPKITSTEQSYRFIINTNKKALFFDLNYRDLKGWFGHELGHIPRYEAYRTKPQFAIFTANYLFNKYFRFLVEREADIETFKHGLGLELLISTKKSFVSERMPASYKKFENMYIQSWEVIQDYVPKELTRDVYDKIISSKSILELNTFYDLKK